MLQGFGDPQEVAEGGPQTIAGPPQFCRSLSQHITSFNGILVFNWKPHLSQPKPTLKKGYAWKIYTSEIWRIDFPKMMGRQENGVVSGFKFGLMLGIYVKFQGATLLPYSYSMTSGDSYCWWAEILANQHVGWLKTHRTRLLLSGFSHQRACNFRWRGLCYIRDYPPPSRNFYIRPKNTPLGTAPIIGNNPSRRTNNIISSSFQMSFFSPKNSFRKRHTQQKPPRTLSLMLSSQKRVAAIAMGHGYP